VSARELAAERRHRVDDIGKKRYWPLLRFRDRDARLRWERAVFAALTDAGVTP
jgi:hypothetical protein